MHCRAPASTAAPPSARPMPRCCCGAPCACDDGPAVATPRLWPQAVHGTIRPHMNPDQYVQDKAAASGSSFYYAFLFLPRERRAAITAFYAFCREVDDVVDEVSDPGVAATKLGWWQNEVHQAFAGKPSHPVMRALMPHAPVYGIEERHLQAVIDGCRMDLEQTRYLDFQGLTRYCHLVAGVVGEVAARIFGQTQEETTAYAHKMGLAFQLTNIIRDVGEDAMRGRIYLPISELQQFDVKAHEITKREYSDRFTALIDRKSTRLNSSHTVISYAVFCLKKKKRVRRYENVVEAYTQ